LWEELPCLAGQFFVRRSTALRQRALRPQLKRDPLDSEVRSTFGFIGRHEDALS
jgi:hypothetical protein